MPHAYSFAEMSCTRRPDNSEGELASLIGVMQAIISVFIDDGDKIRHIMAGSTRITFLLRSPLYYCCVSNWKEPDSVVSSSFIFLNQDPFGTSFH